MLRKNQVSCEVTYVPHNYEFIYLFVSIVILAYKYAYMLVCIFSSTFDY